MFNPVKNKSADAIWLFPLHSGIPASPRFWIFVRLQPAPSDYYFLHSGNYPDQHHDKYLVSIQLSSSFTDQFLRHDPVGLVRTSILAFFFPLEHLKFSYLCYMEQMSVGRFLRIKAMCAH